MFKNSFDTAAGSAVFPHALPGRLLVAKAEGTVNEVSQFPGILALTENSKENANIPVFRHPFSQTILDKETTFIDLRPYRSVLTYGIQGEVEFNNEGAVGIMFRRAVLESIWEKSAIDGFFFNIDVPLVIFSKWVSGLLKSKLTLNEAVAQKAQAIIAYYYYCLHIEKADFNDRKKEVFAVKISRMLNIPYQRLESWFMPLDYLANIDDLCTALAQHSGSLSLSRIDKRVIWNLTATSWYGGSDVRELIGVSLEYPPAFVAMIYAACANEKFYRKAFLSQLVEKEKRNIKADNFVGTVNDLIRSAASYPGGKDAKSF